MPPVTPQALTEAIAKCWADIERAFGGSAEWRLFSDRLLQQLREFDDLDADHLTIAQGIVALFASHPAANEVLVAALGGGQEGPVPESADDGGLGSPWAAIRPRGGPANRPTIHVEPRGREVFSEILVRHTLVSVLFGTDRMPVASLGEPIRYSAEPADDVSFGIATVSIPDDHRKGELARPRWYRLEFRVNPDKHVVLANAYALMRADFIASAAEASDRDGSRDEVLIFVHGYKVEFQASILRTAQLAYDLDFRGTAIAYSWPSEGALFGYAADADAAESSAFLFAEFLRLVQTELDVRRIHIIAHSMGSRLLARAMDRLWLAPATGARADIHQVVFAAPDISPRTFERLARNFTQICERCTLYASSRDMALYASRLIHHFPRLGDTSKDVAVIRGVDTIDATNVDSSLIGHSSFGDRRTILADLFELFQNGRGPAERFGLREVVLPGGRYWEFVP
jgi:esterase/lipase superfamily enzyme